MAVEHTDLQSTVEAIYRVNADEQARAEIIEHERYLRDQRTQQAITQRLTNTIAEQNNTISEQALKIAELEAKLATLTKQA